MRNPLVVISDTFKAFMRGDRRVAPHGTTGRVYESKKAGATDDHASSARASATLEMVVTRKDGTVERIKVPTSAVKVARHG